MRNPGVSCVPEKDARRNKRLLDLLPRFAAVAIRTLGGAALRERQRAKFSLSGPAA
jgi:hypothetical protein